MTIDYIGRDEWRGRGRPRVPADPEVMARLQYTYDSGTVGRLLVAADTDPAEVRATITQLRRAADEIGLTLRLQPRRSKDILAAGELRFYAEDQ
jgi:hypothetical protein